MLSFFLSNRLAQIIAPDENYVEKQRTDYSEDDPSTLPPPSHFDESKPNVTIKSSASLLRESESNQSCSTPPQQQSQSQSTPTTPPPSTSTSQRTSTAHKTYRISPAYSTRLTPSSSKKPLSRTPSVVCTNGFMSPLASSKQQSRMHVTSPWAGSSPLPRTPRAARGLTLTPSKLTPAKNKNHTNDTHSNSNSKPASSSSSTGTGIVKTLEQQIYNASLLTSRSLSLLNWEKRKDVFTSCASTKRPTGKKLQALRKTLLKDTNDTNDSTGSGSKGSKGSKGKGWCGGPSGGARYRATELGNLVCDGFTPLHAAAAFGNVDVVGLLVELDRGWMREHYLLHALASQNEDDDSDDGSSDDDDDDNDESEKEPYESLLSLKDLLGRTPLHVASSSGHVETVKILRNAMKDWKFVLDDLYVDVDLDIGVGIGIGVTTAASSKDDNEDDSDDDNFDPIGPNAPTDISGRTPLGTAGSTNIRKLKDTLYKLGDKSICPNVSTVGRFNINSNSDEGTSGTSVSFGYAEIPGMRVDMEDAVCVHIPVQPRHFKAKAKTKTKSNRREADNNWCLFGVFDGHGGPDVSKVLGNEFCEVLVGTEEWVACNSDDNDDGSANPRSMTYTQIFSSITTACSKLDERLRTSHEKGHVTGGSTAIFSLVTDDSIYVANVGDSRCIVININIDEGKGKENAVIAVAMSEDHKPSLPNEHDRVVKAGLTVHNEVIPASETVPETVISKILLKPGENDRIAVSRAFGDFEYKSQRASDSLSTSPSSSSSASSLKLPLLPSSEQPVICTPEIMVRNRGEKGDRWMVLACDGIWDVMSNSAVAAFIYDSYNSIKGQAGGGVEEGEILAIVGDALVRECLRLGSEDNMTVVIVDLTLSHKNDGDDDDDNDNGEHNEAEGRGEDGVKKTLNMEEANDMT